ncbi:TolC family outer membrane protein [Glycocaulis profundi]|nr:TolC family outer membrane protein [Glycocaulis profundi]
MKISRTPLAASLFLALAMGAPAAAQTLEETLAAAYQSNPVLAAERARLRQTEEGFYQARAGRLPSISAGADIGDGTSWGPGTGSSAPIVDEDGNPIPGTGTGGGGSSAPDLSYSVSASQPLYRGGRIDGNIDAAIARIEAARAGLLSVEQQVLLDAIAAHMNIVRDTQVVSIRRNNVEVLNEQLRASRDRFEVGEITRTDVAQAEAAVAAAQAQLSAAQAQLAASRAQYERVVGVQALEVQAPDSLPALPESLGMAAETATVRNPAIISAQYQEEAARQQVRIARGALLPEASLTASASESRQSDFTGRARGSASIGARVSVPIFTGGLNRSQVRQAQAGVDEARLLIVSARRNVIEDVTNAWNDYLTAQAVIESSREAVRANEIAFEGVEQEALVGLRTTLDVLQTQQTLLDSRLQLVQAERDLQVAAYVLRQAIGSLYAESLGLPVDVVRQTREFDNSFMPGDLWGR